MKEMCIKLIMIGILLPSSSTLTYADTAWTTPGTPIPPGSTSGVQSLFVDTAFDPTTGQFLATWSNTVGNFIPYYAIYNGTTWTTPGTPIPIGSSVGASRDVFTSSDSLTGQFIVTWADNSGLNPPFYAIFDGTNWTTDGTAVPLGDSSGVWLDVATCANPGNEFLVTWADYHTQAGFYAIYNGTIWTTDGTAVPLGSSIGVLDNIVSSFDPINGQYLVTWIDTNPPNTPYYAIFDGTSWTTQGTVIPAGASSGIADNISTSVDPTTGRFLAIWADFTNQHPYYAIYQGTSWTTPGTAIPLGTSSGVTNDIFAAFDPTTGQFVATWNDSNTHAPYYALFSGTSWTPGAKIPRGTSSGVSEDIVPSFDSNTGNLIATWGDYISLAPFYALYSSFVPSVLPPASLTVKAFIDNQFGVVKELYNLLKWAPSPTQGVSGYHVYRNGTLIASVGANVFKYKDHNRKKHEFIIYSVTTVDANGNESAPITVTVD